MSITRRRAISSSLGTLALFSLPPILRLSPGALAQSATFDYYISPTGSDGNPGTAAQPWSITALNTKGALLSGKRIGLLDGTYRMPTSVGDWPAAWAYGTSAASGTASAYTTIEAVNLHGAVFTSNQGNDTYPQRNNFCFSLDGNYIRLKGVRFYQFHQWAVNVAGNNLLIEDCSFEDFDHRRIQGQGKDNFGMIGSFTSNKRGCVIRNCFFKDAKAIGFNGSVGSRGGGCAPFYNYGDVTIEFCTFIDVEAAFYPKRDMCGYTFRYNYVRNANRAIYSVFHGNEQFGRAATEIHNNVFVNCNYMTYEGVENNMSIRPVSYYNNTYYHTGTPAEHCLVFMAGSGTPNLSYRHNVHSNIFHAAGGSPQAGWIFWNSTYQRAASTMEVLDYNLYGSFRLVDDPAGIVATNLSSWRSATGLDQRSLGGVNPQFVNVAGTSAEDFKLQAGSPGIGAGRNATNMGAWDGRATQIGCNFAGGSIVRPLSPQLSIS